ncbi:hypothetical protein [Methylobacterium oryzihabitans]|uniref:Uncharacterized protein n=1 Tax=Methylobacterium oryzihabitans TaxID=2499852 RepID=A0A3S2YVN4_9HYPH|nr:hypothetical protein [Methylobacterium oryzihabitans]RVU20281.1 hypothetical protein EOE48_06660 [Methylobacterium oryzihabitans]
MPSVSVNLSPLSRSDPPGAASRRPAAGAEARRRDRDAALERAVFAITLVLAAASSGFAAWTIGGAGRAAIASDGALPSGLMTWKRGVVPAEAEPTVTGALPKRPAVEAPLGSEIRPADEPLGRGYVVRAVLEGVATVEGPDGLRVVAPGMLLPGAGRVLSIRPSGPGWLVVTTETVITTPRP